MNKLIISVIVLLGLSTIYCENFRGETVTNDNSFKEFVEVTDYVKGLVQPPESAKDYQMFAGEIEVGPTTIFKDGMKVYQTDETGKKNRMFYEIVSKEGEKIIPNAENPGTEDIPLILWLQGGPGASGWFGNIVEMGPYFIDKNEGGDIYLKVNKNSWNQKYYMLFIDSPIGAGLSSFVNPDGTFQPTDKNPMTNSTDMAVAAVENFLIKFFSIYKQFQKQPFYIFGESFGGHYVPGLSARLIDNYVGGIEDKDLLAVRDIIQKQFRGMGVGDLFTNLREQADSYHTYLQSAGLISTWRKDFYQKLSGSIVEHILNEEYTKATDEFFVYDGKPISYSKANITKTNLYNFRKYGQYDAEKYLPELMKTAGFQNAYSLPADVANNFAFGRDPLYLAYSENIPRSYAQNITKILNGGKHKVLLYQGQNDLDVPYQGVQKMMMTIKWPGLQQWRKADKIIWKDCDGSGSCTHYGWKKCYAQFGYAMINNAGHLVPAEQGYDSLSMVEDFINDQLCVL